MPLALFSPAASPAVPTGSAGALSDDELFGAANPVAPPPQAHTLAPVPLSDDEVFAQPSPMAPARPSLIERGKANFESGFGNSIQGALSNLFDSQIAQGVQTNLREGGQGEAADAYQRGLDAQRTTQQQRFGDMPSFTTAPTVADKVKEGAVSLIGQLFGGAMSPEGLVTEVPGVSRVVAPVTEKFLPKAAARTVEAGANQAVVQTVTDPAVQGANIASGVQKTYDPIQTALSPALGFLLGGTVHGVTEGIPAMADAFRAWRAGREKSPATDVPGTPDAVPSQPEIDEFAGSPEMAAFLKANGITKPDDPRIIQLQDRLAARRGAEADKTKTQPQDAGGASAPQFLTEQERLAAERDAAQSGVIAPEAISTAGRVPRAEVPPVIQVTPAGQGDVGDLGVRAGIDKAGEVKQDIQDKASNAFRLAQLQRDRAQAQPSPFDTQPAARPQGADQQSVVLDEGFPVQVLGRKFATVDGRKVEVATVHRYDPRTGKTDPEAVPYDVPVRQLKTSNYAVEPRAAQDFVQRAKGPAAPELPRMADEAVKREPNQTFRTTAQDPNAEFPGATRPGPEDGSAPEGRSPLPKQPEGPGPFRQRPSSEEEAIRDFEQRQRHGNEDFSRRQRQKEGPRKEDNKASSIAAARDLDGRYPVDDRAFVLSDKGGPVKFADQKQAAKWIINEGHKKSPDQIFEIENHPSEKGFTVHERGRTEPKPKTENEPPPGAAGAAGAREPGGGLPGALPVRAAPRGEAPKAEAAPKAKGPVRGTLFDAIRAKGGVRDDRGDISQIMQGYKNPPFKNRVFNPNGLHPDKMREALQADGWFGGPESRFGADAQPTGAYPGDDIKDLHSLMDKEARGEAVYHPGSEPTDREIDRLTQSYEDEEISRAGITDSDTPEEANKKLSDYRDSEAWDFQNRAAQDKLEQASADLSPDDLRDLYDTGWRPEGSRNWQEETGAASDGARQFENFASGEKDAGRNDRETSGVDRGNPEGFESASSDELKARARAKDAQERQQNPRAYSGKKQKKPDEGLFSDTSEKNQSDMFGDEEKSAENIRDRFSANPAFDPENYRDLGRSLHGVFGWAKNEADAWTRHLENIVSAWPKKDAKGEGALAHLGHTMQVFFLSNDGVLRSLASKHKSSAIMDIANEFFAASRGGRDGAVKQTYFEAQNERYSRWMNELDDLTKPLANASIKDREQMMEQAGRLIVNPGAIKPGTPVHDIAAGITKQLKEILSYMREAGVEVGEVKRGYLPRIENTDKILLDPEGFKAAAKRAFMADGITGKEAEKSAEEWLNRVRLGDLGVRSEGNDFLNIGGGTNTPNFTQARVLSKKADDILGDFYLRNPSDIMPRYILKAVRKAEWSRRLGPRGDGSRVPHGEDAKTWRTDPLGKWKDYKQRMDTEGASAAQAEVVQIIKSMTGNMGAAATGGQRRFLSLARTWGAFTYLSRATFASLSEPVSIAIRTGNAGDLLRAYGNTVRHWVPTLRKIGDGKYLEEMGKDLGIIGDAIDNLALMQRVGSDDNTQLARRLQSNFFRHVGLTQFTEANRIASMQIGMTFMRRLASDVVNKSHVETMSRNLLAELGIEDPDKFSKWVLDRDGKPNISDILEGGDMGRIYHTALGRFVSQTVMHPTGATKPRYANHPLGSLLYNLQSFTYAFQKNILNRAGQMTLDAVNPKSGLNGVERMKYLAPLAMMVPLFCVQYALGEIRDQLFTDPARAGQQPKTTTEKVMTAVSRSGMDGISDWLVNTFGSFRYQRDPAIALAGPIYGMPLQMMGDAGQFFGKDNSPNTNTTERKVTRDIYNNIIVPTLIAGITATAPASTGLGLVLGASGIAGVSHPGVREQVVKAADGPPLPPR